MMKKILALAAALVLVLGLASCGSTSVQSAMHVDIDAFLAEFSDAEYTLQPDGKLILGNEENLIDVKSYLIDGAADATEAVNSAVQAAAAVGGIVYFSEGEYDVGNVEIPKDVGFAVATSAVIKVKSGCVFKVNSEDLYIPKKAVLTGEGSYDFTEGLNYCYPDWFGSGTEGMQKAVNAAETVYLTKTTYTIDTTVVLPQGRNIEIIGMAFSGTNINNEVYNSDGSYTFSYVYEEGAPTSVSFSYLQYNDGTGGSGVLLNYEGDPATKAGSVTMYSVRIPGGKSLVQMTNATGNLFSEIFAPGNGTLAVFNGGVNDTTFTKVLCSGNKVGLISADGGEEGAEGLWFYHSSSVTGAGIDFEIKNYKNVNFIDSSGDLGVGKENKACLYMENVNGFKVIRCWWASNAGLSCSTSMAIPQKRVGLYLVNCEGGFISGCSIVNQIEGVKIIGGSADNRIVIEGNTLQGNGYSDITLDGATGVDVHGNFFNSGNQWGQINKSPRLEGGNYAVWVKNGPTSCTVKYNCFGKTYHDDDGAVKSTSGVESTDNLF